MAPRKRSNEIASFLIRRISEGQPRLVDEAAMHFGITRQAVGLHLKRLVRSGVVDAKGKTRARTYILKEVILAHFQTRIAGDLAEDMLWRAHVAESVRQFPQNVVEICQYGFTEMVNNAIFHSEGNLIQAWLVRAGRKLKLLVSDDGVGVFAKIRAALHLEDERHAILELSKGKLTTDPARHTGEGIFFTSRMFDEFLILSGNLFFSHEALGDDWLIEARATPTKGTSVQMLISLDSARTTREVFDKYSSSAGDYSFTRTHVPVSLLRYGAENLVSRSQARRLLVRFERFGEVLLDFEGVPMIGQAFADEIFRVYAREHPEVKVTWIRASPEVEKMIMRALAAAKENVQ